MRALVIFALAGLGTYLIRISGIVLLGGSRELPERLVRSLRLVAPAALAAIVANTLLLDEGAWRGFGPWHVAGAVAIAVALWKRTAGWALLAGAVAFAAMLLAGW